MARYAIVTDMTRPRFDVIMVHFEIRDDSTTPETVIMTATHGFQAVRYDDQGAIIAETLVQRRTRLQSEFNAYIQRILDQATAGDAQFDTIRSQAVGYRYPAAP